MGVWLSSGAGQRDYTGEDWKYHSSSGNIKLDLQ